MMDACDIEIEGDQEVETQKEGKDPNDFHKLLLGLVIINT